MQHAKIFSGTGSQQLAEQICKQFGTQLGKVNIQRFSDGEIYVEFEESIRGKFVFLIQSTFAPTDNMMELLLMIDAAKRAKAHDFIMQLPGGYDYKVMERGATLSLGQRQLLSFIRALLYNPSILILDEATSSIDTESEQLIERAIDALIKGRTSIVIAHRLSTIRKANKIIVLDKGKIQEMGSHDQLLQLGGFYAKLNEMQFKDKKSIN